MQNPSILEKVYWVCKNEGPVFFIRKKLFFFLDSLKGDAGKLTEFNEQKAAGLERLLSRKNYQRVLSEGLCLLRSQPFYFPYLRSVGQAYLELGHYRQAYKYFDKARNVDAKKGRATASLAVVSFMSGEIEKSRVFFKEALTYEDSRPQTLGQWLYLEKNSTEAERISLFRKALILEPLAEHYSIQWILELHKLLGQEGEAEISDYLSPYITKFPKDIEARSLKLEFDAKEKGESVFEEILGELSRRNPDRDQCLVVYKALKALVNADKEFLMSKFREVNSILLENYPELDEPYASLATLIRNDEDLTFRSFDKTPAKYQALDFFLAGTTFSGKEGKRAEVSALEMLLRMREEDTIEKNLQAIIDRQTSDSDVKGLQSIASIHYARKGNFEKAHQYRLLGLKKEGETADHLLAMGRSQSALGNLSQAYKLFSEAQRKKPGVPGVERAMAECELELGLIDDARSRVQSLKKLGITEHWMEDFELSLAKYASAQVKETKIKVKILNKHCTIEGSDNIEVEFIDQNQILSANSETTTEHWTLFVASRDLPCMDQIVTALSQASEFTGYFYSGMSEDGLKVSGSRIPGFVASRSKDLNIFAGLSIGEALKSLLSSFNGTFLPYSVADAEFELEEKLLSPEERAVAVC